MRFRKHIFLFFSCFFFSLISEGQGVFEPNRGQWSDDFQYRLKLNFGTAFVEDGGIKFHLIEGDHHHHHENEHDEHENDRLSRTAFKLEFDDPESDNWEAQDELALPYNYFLSNDPSKWKSNLHASTHLKVNELYQGIDIDLKIQDQHLKYDFTVQPQADISKLRYRFDGVQSVKVKNGKLLIETGIGEIEESIPSCFQIINSEKRDVKCKYVLSDDGFISFDIGKHNPAYPIVIDPILVFSSFSASSADNWGFTATYDDQANLYGGGISFGAGYPTSTGTYQNAFAGGVIDIAITKFNSDGTQALYATYIGGSSNEQPHSLIVDGQGNLVILGITGSGDFPVDAQAYQSTFNGGTAYPGSYNFSQGTDLFICKLSNDGSQLLGSTFFGGSLNDGINDQFAVNYADEFRGEVVVDDLNNIYIASVTQSADVNVQNAFQPAMGGWQDALVASFPTDLHGINWASYYGGTVADNANALELADDGSLYVVGGTRSANLLVSLNAVSGSLNGNSDGYILRLSSGNGSFLNASFIGSNSIDQVYMVESDRYGSVYILGQTFGVMPLTAGVFSQTPGGQFLQKLNGDLTNLEWGTVIGNGTVPNLSPTAFLVDDCLNIYVSGWGGVTNSTNLGDMDNMPITADAFQPTTDGSEFYFLVLEENARALQFASYYGGQANEHVDAGTSRFSSDGTIYQSVCAGCGNQTFPTTPGVYGPNNMSPNCNLGVIKIDFESSIGADATIDLNFIPDTICDTLIIRFENNSFNANQYIWNFGNGKTSFDEEPIARFDTLGTYTVSLIAIDTLCNTSDTSFIQFSHTRGTKPQADFEYSLISCNPEKPVQFSNTSTDAQSFIWDFGDGQISNFRDPSYVFGSFGVHTIQMIAIDTLCFSSDTVEYDIEFVPVSFRPSISVDPPDCGEKQTLLEVNGSSDSLQVEWIIQGYDSISGNSQLSYVFPSSGDFRITTRIEDTVCGDFQVYDTTITVTERIERLFVPNIFTPNGDNLNEKFEIYGDECYANARFMIFNRWGELIFESKRPFEEFWTGFNGSTPVLDGVYQWVMIHDLGREYGFVTVLR